MNQLVVLIGVLSAVTAIATALLAVLLGLRALGARRRGRARWQVLSQLSPCFFDHDRLTLAALEASAHHGFGLVTKVLHEARRELQGDLGTAIDESLQAIGEHTRLHRASRSWNRRRRLRAIEALGRCGGEEASNFLRTMLSHPDAVTRRAVRSALADLPGRAERRAALDSFVADELEPFGWGATFFARVGRSDPEELFEWVRSGSLDNRHRKLVLEALADVEFVQALDLAREFLTSSDPELRASAARALRNSDRASDEEALGLALRDPVWFVRSAAAGALRGHLPLERITTDRLISSLGDTNWWVRYNASRSLAAGPIQDPDQARVLRSALSEDDLIGTSPNAAQSQVPEARVADAWVH